MNRLRTGWLARVLAAISVALAFPLYTYAATVTGSVSAGVSFNAITTATTGATSTISVRLPSGLAPINYTSGTGAFQVNKLWFGTFSLASTTTTLDLTALSGGYGDTSFSAVKVFTVIDHETTASKKITVGNAASNQFVPGGLSSGTVTWDVDGGATSTFMCATAAGWTVDSSHKSVKFDSGSNTVSFSVVIAGN